MNLSSIQLGPVEVTPPLILAPMSGVTGSAFRRLVKELNPGSVGLVVTEFISVEALTRQNPRSLQLMDHDPEERPLSVQIFGHDINRMLDAALMAQDAGADIIDINSGCPVPRVVKRGGGCELMRQPEHLEKILATLAQALSIPLTLKMRSGWDANSRNAVEIAKRAEGVGVRMIAVHGRTRVDQYRGLADWNFIGEVARAVSIPVIGSGDITNGTTAKRALEQGVSGLMIGRGALANPWIFGDIQKELCCEQVSIRPLADVIDAVIRYRELLLETLPEKAAIGRLKQLASQSFRGQRGAPEIRRGLCTAKSLAEFSQLLEIYREQPLGSYDQSYDFAIENEDSSAGYL